VDKHRSPLESDEERQRIEAQEAEIERLKVLQADYRKVFGGPSGEVVLKDLRERCGYDADLFNKDDRIEAKNLGERDVFRHINSMLTLNIEELKAQVKNASSQSGE